MSEPTYLKVLSKTGQACHGGEFDYSPHLPSENGPGLELPQRKPALCKSGWHWCSPDSLMRNWAVAGMQVYEAEPSADVPAFDNAGKCVSSSGRLVRPFALLSCGFKENGVFGQRFDQLFREAEAFRAGMLEREKDAA